MFFFVFFVPLITYWDSNVHFETYNLVDNQFTVELGTIT